MCSNSTDVQNVMTYNDVQNDDVKNLVTDNSNQNMSDGIERERRRGINLENQLREIRKSLITLIKTINKNEMN